MHPLPQNRVDKYNRCRRTAKILSFLLFFKASRGIYGTPRSPPRSSRPSLHYLEGNSTFLAEEGLPPNLQSRTFILSFESKIIFTVNSYILISFNLSYARMKRNSRNKFYLEEGLTCIIFILLIERKKETKN